MDNPDADPSFHGPHNSVGSPYINIQLPRPTASGIIAFVGAILGMGGIFAVTIAVAKNADWKAQQAKADMATYQTQIDGRVGSLGIKHDLLSLWAQRVIVACEANGVKVPPLPENSH